MLGRLFGRRLEALGVKLGLIIGLSGLILELLLLGVVVCLYEC